MNSYLSAPWLAAALTLITLVASAQTGTSPDQATPQARPEPAPYRSALEGYQPFIEEKTAPWRASNDTVGKVGGWRAYAKEAQEPAAQPGPKAPGAAVDPHAGHKH